MTQAVEEAMRQIATRHRFFDGDSHSMDPIPEEPVPVVVTSLQGLSEAPGSTGACRELHRVRLSAG
jgi:hypothetical protein